MISDGKNTLLRIGGNADIVTCFQKCYEQFKEQPMALVEELQGLPVDSACESCFGYMVDNVFYKLDPDGYQFIKSPARLLSDGYGDCKSLTMFIACCLYCLGIPCIVRFVNFDGGTQYTHVYPVAIDERGNEIILDMCELNEDGLPIYNYARPFNRKKDIYYGK